nr:MAG TPA: hypothetical protein [Caudoviricetes sp.]
MFGVCAGQGFGCCSVWLCLCGCAGCVLVVRVCVCSRVCVGGRVYVCSMV